MLDNVEGFYMLADILLLFLLSIKISERKTIFSRRYNLAKLCIKLSVMITNNNICTYLHLKY